MNQDAAQEIIDNYEKLRADCFAAYKADNSLQTEGLHFVNLSESDIAFIEPQADHVLCSGSTWTSIFGGSHESFEIRVPYSLLGDS